MEVEFADADLDRLETDPTFTMGLSSALVRASRRRVQSIRAAPDERELYSQKSWHFEKLSGKRDHQRSVHLNGQFRLTIEFAGSGHGKRVRIIAIEDYH